MADNRAHETGIPDHGAPDGRDARDERFMARAIELARRAEGRTRPNPMVGCVIVRGDAIVAEGYHARAGSDHGEVAALKNLSGSAEGCELYVNLEPCSHHGRTPPCSEAIVAAGIRRVVIGAIDPNPRVSGQGVARLRAAGIEVRTGVLEREARALNAPFFKHITTGMPWVSVKYAMSLDGKIATSAGESAWISGESSRRHVHHLRAVYDAILVGTGTLRADNPRLNCRLEGGRDPARIVLDARLEASPELAVFNLESDAPTLLVTAEAADSPRARPFVERGVQLVTVGTDPAGRLDLPEMLRALGRRDLLSVLVEGGGQLVGSLVDAGLVDRFYAYVSPRIIGGAAAPGPVAGRGFAAMADVLRLENVRHERFDDDLLVVGDVPKAHRQGASSQDEHHPDEHHPDEHHQAVPADPITTDPISTDPVSERK